MKAKLINLASIAGTELPPQDYYRRDNLIDALIKNWDHRDAIILEGEKGVGKSVFLQGFILNHCNESLSYCIDKNYIYSKSYDFVIESLYQQIYFFLHNEQTENNDVTDSMFLQICGALYKKLRTTKRSLYLVLDGFHHLTLKELESLRSIFSNIPYRSLKIIFSGEQSQLESLFGIADLRIKSIPLLNFSFDESRIFLKNLTNNTDLILEVHKLSRNGLPEDLAFFKTTFANETELEKFISEGANKSILIDKQWSQIENRNPIFQNVIGYIAYCDFPLKAKTLAKILKIDLEEMNKIISEIFFIEIKDSILQFTSATYEDYAKMKLSSKENEVMKGITLYLEENSNDDSSEFLPELYAKQKNWNSVIRYYSPSRFVELISIHKTLGGLSQKLSNALNASKRSENFNEARFRFTLYLSSFKDIQKFELWISEIEALLALDDYESAITLAESVYLKEDRLKLLAILAKQLVLNKKPQDASLIEKIRSLYHEVDFTSIPEKGLEISSLLVYSAFDLSIELVEKLSDKTAGKNSLDYALAYLRIFIGRAQVISKNSEGDLDTINSKIKDERIKDFTKAASFLSTEFNAEEVVLKSKQLEDFGQRMFLLKNWINDNKDHENVSIVVDHAIESIVTCSNDNVPNATTLMQIAEPLKYVKDVNVIKQLSSKFEALINTVQSPTIDWVTLQLTIAQALNKYDNEKSKDKIYDVYLFIDDLDDLSLKNDCLCILWDTLLIIDKRGKIEDELTKSKSLKQIISDNLKILLSQTAYHYKLVEVLIKTTVIREHSWVCSLIDQLNTVDRRDYAFFNSINVYLEKSKIDSFPIDKVIDIMRRIDDIKLIEELICDIVEKYSEELKDPLKIPELLKLESRILSITTNVDKAFVLTKLIAILNLDAIKYGPKISEYFEYLEVTWNAIDVRWKKVEIGFLIAKELSKFDKENALKYFDESTEIKKNVRFTSDTNAKIYLDSIDLCVHALSGLIELNNDLSNDFYKLEELIDNVDSVSYRARIWTDVALQLLSKGKRDNYSLVVKKYILPNLQHWDKLDTSFKQNAIVYISPVLFANHSELFFQDYFDKLNNSNQQAALNIISDFILTNTPFESISDNFNQSKVKIEYPGFNDLCRLIKRMNIDGKIWKYISYTLKAMKANRHILNKSQTASLISILKDIVKNNLPATNYISHEGYKILCEAELLNFENAKVDQWDKLIDRARLILNLSDKAFVIMMIAEICNLSKSKKINLMDEAMNIVKSISSRYDKSLRLSSMCEVAREVDNSKWRNYIGDAFSEIMKSKDTDGLDEIRNIIDMVNQHEPNLADSMITMLDADPARAKLKDALKKRINNLSQIKEARKDYRNLSSLSRAQLQEVFGKNLNDLKSGKLSTKDINETICVLDQVDGKSLSDSFNALTYFVLNASKKYERSKSQVAILNSIFDATYENARLVALLSQENVDKMRLTYSVGNGNLHKGLVKIGEDQNALDFIKNWLEDKNPKEIILIDPFFSESDLKMVREIFEVLPKAEWKILTGGKKTGKNCHKSVDGRSENKEVYVKEWTKLSSEPIFLNIKIVWDKNTKDVPFHDRYLLIDDHNQGLSLGTSFNGWGNKDSGISELTEITRNHAKYVYDTYFYRETVQVDKYVLKYERFDLDVDD